MTIYNDGTNSFVWKGARYGFGTVIKLHEDFWKSFRWNGEKTSRQGSFYSMHISDGKKIFQFERECPGEWLHSDRYPLYFSLTELEMLTAIESIEKNVPVEEVTADEPPFAEKQLDIEYTGRCNFFKANDCYYGSGSRIYITDDFINHYYYKTGKRLTKKIMFLDSHFESGERKYWISCCDDMKEERFNDYMFIDGLTEEEFLTAIEFITDCNIIKYKSTDEPTIFIFYILAIMIMALSFIIFVEPSPIILLVLIGLRTIRKALLCR